jgi:hypothetical protein
LSPLIVVGCECSLVLAPVLRLHGNKIPAMCLLV